MKSTKARAEHMGLEDKVRLLCETVGFGDASREELEEIGERAFGRRFVKGEYVFREGDRAEHFLVVASGRIKLTKTSSEGRSFTAILAGRGYTLNAVALFGMGTHFLSAQAMEDSLILCIKAEDFHSFVLSHPKVAVGIITVLGRIVESTYERMIDMVGERVEQRLLNVLNMLYHKYGESLSFTNTELADMAGTTTETTIRVVSRLRELGIIDTRRGQVRIVDRSRLMELSRGPFLI